MNIAVFFDAPHYDDYPFNKEEYKEAYHSFARRIAGLGHSLSIVRSMDTYKGNLVFDGCWEFDGETFQRKDGEVKMDRLYNKAGFASDEDLDIVNTPELEKLCTDKQSTYNMFPEHSPISITVEREEDLSEAIEKIPGEMLVAKPLDEKEGVGVFIGSKEEVASQIQSYPYIVQEYLDLSGGIPGVVDGIHDFRVVTINGEQVLAFVRTPPPGGLLANVSQGGATHEVPIEDMPQGARAIVDDIDAKLSHITRRAYSIDMGRLPDGTWKIIELNARPGLFAEERGQDFVRFHEKLAEMLTK